MMTDDMKKTAPKTTGGKSSITKASGTAKNAAPDQEHYRAMYRAFCQGDDDTEFWDEIEKKANGESVPQTDVTARNAAGAPNRGAIPAEADKPVRKTAAKKPADGETEKPVNSSSKKGNPKTPDEPSGIVKKKNRKGRRIFIICLVLWMILLGVGGYFVLKEVDRELKEYEEAQIENHYDDLSKEFTASVRSGAFDQIVKLPELDNGFEDRNLLNEKYLTTLKGVSVFRLEKSEKSYSTTSPLFDVYGDDKLVATVKAEAVNPRKKLLILEICDWKIDAKTLSPKFDVTTTGYSYQVPDNYTVTVNGKQLGEDYEVSRTKIPSDLKYVSEYVPVSVNVTYVIKDLVDPPEVVITDQNGEPVEIDESQKDEKGNISMPYRPVSSEDIPQDRADLVYEVAKKDMDFLTKDLPGKNYGLETIRSYFVKDSIYYNKLYEYAHSVDITFISDHTVSNPAVSDLKLSNYTEYNDKAFSCSVYFVKNMRLTKTGAKATSVMDSTFYFVYYDDTDDGVDNPRWAAVDKLTNTAGTEGTQE